MTSSENRKFPWSSGVISPYRLRTKSRTFIGYIIPQNPQNHMELGVLVFYVTVTVSGVLAVAATCLAVF
jgi:hypothetical protein